MSLLLLGAGRCALASAEQEKKDRDKKDKDRKDKLANDLLLLGTGKSGAAASAGGIDYTTSLVSHWKLADVNDAVGGQTLTNNAVVTFNTGQIGNAAYMASASSQYLSRANESAINLTGLSFSWVCWFYLTGLGVQDTLVCKGDSLNDGAQLIVTSGNVLSFEIGNDFTNAKGVLSLTALSSATWYMASATYNQSTKLMSLALNAGTPVTDTWTGTSLTSNSAALRLGRPTDSVLGSYLNGRLDAVSYYVGRVLSAADITGHYNAGTGREHPFS